MLIFMPIFALAYTYLFGVLVKGFLVFVWPFFAWAFYEQFYPYKSYAMICGTLSDIKLQISEAYIFVWLESEKGRDFRKELDPVHAVCDAHFPDLNIALFWPGMTHARTLERKTGFMSVLLTPSSVREQSSTAWIETITRTRENNEIQRIEFDGALNLFYALKVKSTPEFHKKDMYWTDPGSGEQVIIECEFIESSPPRSCHQRWVNDSVGSIVSVGYKPIYKKHWRHIKTDVDYFIEGLKVKD